MVTQLEGQTKTNNDLTLANKALQTELAICKIEMKSLERNKVKHDLDKAIIDRNRQNADLLKETEELKSKLSYTIKSFEKKISEKENVISKKNVRKEKYLEELVCLKDANQVMSDLLKSYQQPTHTIPLISKKKNSAIRDLHKTALGRCNPRPNLHARKISPSIYDANVLLYPDHEQLSVWQTKETLALDHESRAKMLENPGLVPPVDYKALNKLYDNFVSQKEPTFEQVCWQPPKEVSKPVTPFVHTRPKKSEVLKSI